MLQALESFATTIQSKFSAVVAGRQEDQYVGQWMSYWKR